MIFSRDLWPSSVFAQFERLNSFLTPEMDSA